MLPKQYRITPFEMRLVLGRGKYVRHGGLKMMSVPLKSQGSPKIGFVVPLRIEKKSTGRQRIKRCLREATKSCISDLIPSHAYVLFVEQKIPNICVKTIKPLVKELLSLLNH